MKRATQRAAQLPVSFFRREPAKVGRELLGQLLVSELDGLRVAGRIVEVEVYLGGEDPASHAYRLRRNLRNAALFGPAGSWYVYLSYGIHWCANLVLGTPTGAAVLLRALEPLEGLDLMRQRRGPVADRRLCAGPGRLCQALGITRALDGSLMADAAAWVERGQPVPPELVLQTARIGITKAADWPLRFVEKGSRWGSRRADGRTRGQADSGTD